MSGVSVPALAQDAAVLAEVDRVMENCRLGWFGSVSMQWGQRAFGSDLDYLRTLVRTTPHVMGRPSRPLLQTWRTLLTNHLASSASPEPDVSASEESIW